MRISLVAVLALATTGAAADSQITFNTLTNDLAPCARECWNKYYNEEIGSTCGGAAKASTEASDIKCICTARGSGNEAHVLNSAQSVRECINSNCPNYNTSQTDIDDAEKFAKDAVKYCGPYIDNFSAASGLSVHIPTIIGAAGVLGAIMLP
ncbi:hypothetical protein N7474_010975 [Penicillium riverlandense]|uniref:uncharacterized protein n=1 Tax=Penicillium riverlandense TaxID=1903569 RepID=UPI0025470036|nr:uncharacterized protein N7474_010975 [Penicillium riverlandense]KAJ5805088.1 hypothetical protein N7474_010975 [Penicillium riverlandense]